MEMDMPIPKGRGFTPFPFGQCQVCGAEATGNHYGANTCEGCKGFFKRSLPVFRTFRCFFGNKCDVTPETRNRCKACRFRKCVEAGMALDAVKMGRIPKAVKEHAMEGKSGGSHHRNSSGTGLGRQISSASQATSHMASARTGSPDGADSSPGGGGMGNNGISSPESSADNFSRDGDNESPPPPPPHPMPRNSNSNNATPVSDYRLTEEQHRRQQQQQQHYPGMNAPTSLSTQGGGMKSMADNYRFHPYARLQQQQAHHFKGDRNGNGVSYPYQSAGGGVSGDRLQTGGSSGLLYRADGEQQQQQTKNGQWQPTSRNQPPQSRMMPVPDYTLGGRQSSVTTTTTGDQTGLKSPSAQSETGGKSGVFVAMGGGGGGLFSPAFAGRHPEVRMPNGRIRAMADQAITGDFNENEPDLMEHSTAPEKIKAAMANSETAVVVMHPALQGGTHGMPVVPRDIMVFQPSYVPQDKLPDSPGRDSAVTANHHRLDTKRRRMEVQDVSGGGVKIPANPGMKYFAELAQNPALKTAVGEKTFRVIAAKNADIYGEETRANEEFLREAMSAKYVPKDSEQTPQDMRDVLKDRLITQVKRVVQLSESIPGFRTLNVDDQHSLLRTCILDVWMVHSARFLRDKQSYILFLETRTHYARKWMELFLTDDFLDTVFFIADKINALDLSFDELALLKSILIVRPDRPGLQNIALITAIHNHVLEALKLGIATRRPLESPQLIYDFLELLKGWSVLDLMQEKYVHPIDLSQMAQGPWKIGETASSAASVSSKSSDAGTVSPCPDKQQMLVGEGKAPVAALKTPAIET
ncbi:putative Ecdysone-induced protein 78C [Hypsibius exemplaris]|uniref:Ecdysone-induced protein 78C n=1 Tax=Hypsibius exemplaris TaxID=2072580 RepID=A0A1W0WD55_HYPEX|nr:putative Ecdysone-induced protein 78C [Hypsibius exemplaris]